MPASPEIERYLTLLETRLSLLRALSRLFADRRKEFISMDLDGIFRCIAEQEELCRRIRSLRPAIETLQNECLRQLDPNRNHESSLSENLEWKDRFRNLMRESKDAREELGRLNQTHAAYLRRCNKTVQALMNFYKNYSLSYTRPLDPAFALPRIAERG